MDKKLEQAFKKIFPKFKGKFNDKISPKNLSDWDSLNHIKLVVELEEEFNVKFSNLEVLDMQTYKLVLLAIKNSEKIL